MSRSSRSSPCLPQISPPARRIAQSETIERDSVTRDTLQTNPGRTARGLALELTAAGRPRAGASVLAFQLREALSRASTVGKILIVAHSPYGSIDELADACATTCPSAADRNATKEDFEATQRLMWRLRESSLRGEVRPQDVRRARQLEFSLRVRLRGGEPFIDPQPKKIAV